MSFKDGKIRWAAPIVGAVIVAVALLVVFGALPLPLLGAAPKANDSGARDVYVQRVVRGNNRFALELYSELASTKGNLFFSPYSISTTLTMAYEGARGETASEMQSVIHVPTSDGVRRSAFARIFNQLNAPNSKYDLNTANAIWIQSNYPLSPDYVSIMDSYYVGKAVNVDYAEDAEGARRTINDWVEKRTNSRIKDLLPENSLDGFTRLVLTNATYFKGEWENAFDPKKTSPATFRVSPNKTVQVPMMHQSNREQKLRYAEADGAQVVELPYLGERLSMMVILPREGSLDGLEASLDQQQLDRWRSELRTVRVIVNLPKFSFNSKYFLKEHLKQMGMPLAFNQAGADFSGMTDAEQLYIDSVAHQAFVDVNEKGTEAAAATAVEIVPLSAPLTFVFNADHPFIFLIQDTETGNILFLGRVVDPTQSS